MSADPAQQDPDWQLFQQGDFATLFKHKNNLCSPTGLDFIFRLMQIEPRRRLSITDALSHPWLMDPKICPVLAPKDLLEPDENEPPVECAKSGLISRSVESQNCWSAPCTPAVVPRQRRSPLKLVGRAARVSTAHSPAPIVPKTPSQTTLHVGSPKRQSRIFSPCRGTLVSALHEFPRVEKHPSVPGGVDDEERVPGRSWTFRSDSGERRPDHDRSCQRPQYWADQTRAMVPPTRTQVNRTIPSPKSEHHNMGSAFARSSSPGFALEGNRRQFPLSGGSPVRPVRRVKPSSGSPVPKPETVNFSWAHAPRTVSPVPRGLSPPVNHRVVANVSPTTYASTRGIAWSPDPVSPRRSPRSPSPNCAYKSLPRWFAQQP